jgi:putative membrane protein
MSAPTLPDDSAVGPPERLHPLFLVKGIGGSIRGLAGLYAFLGYLVISGQWSFAILAAIASLLFGIVGGILYWRRFEYRVGQSEIRIDSGILSRRHRSIPFERIQDADITQGPLDRLLGIAQVKLETGGGSAGKNAEEGVLQAITLQRAHELRKLIRARRAGTPSVDRQVQEDRLPVYAMDLRRLLIAGAFNFSLAIFAGLIGITQTFGDALGFDPLSERFWRKLLAASAPLQDFALAHRGVVAIAGSTLLVVIGAATGVIRTVLLDFGFRLDRTETGLRRRRGLLTRTDVTLPLKRAQAALVTTGPFRDAFGWSELSLKSLASDEGGRRAHVLAPLAKHEEINHILSELGWRPLPDTPGWRQVSKSYVGAFALAISPLLLPLAVQALVYPPAAIGFAFGLAGAVGLRWLAWKRTAYALDGDRLLVRTGWWRRRLLVLPFARIQSADVTENFVSRRFGTANLKLGVAGGAMAGEIIPAIPSATARQLREQMLSLPA